MISKAKRLKPNYPGVLPSSKSNCYMCKHGLEQVKCHASLMLTVLTAAAIGRSCSAGNKADIESGAVVVGEYSIIEPGIHVTIAPIFVQDERLPLQSTMS